MKPFQTKARGSLRLGLLMALALFVDSSLQAAPPDGPAGVADRFAAAIAKGDEASVKSLLSDDVLIYESGGQERSLDQYAAHHLQADIDFMSSVQRRVLSRKVFALGEKRAVVATRSRLSGEYKGKPVDSVSTETLVMEHGDGWKIVHIHWSSR